MDPSPGLQGGGVSGLYKIEGAFFLREFPGQTKLDAARVFRAAGKAA